MEYKDSRKYCVGCRYFFGYYEGSRCCNYIFVRGESGRARLGRIVQKGERKRKQETEFNIIALSLYSIYNIILYLVCMLL